MTDGAGDGGDVCASFLDPGVVKLGAWVAEDREQGAENRRLAANGSAGDVPRVKPEGRLSVVCHLTSELACLGLGTGATFERLGPLGCTGCPASTCGLSTWWSTTALDETWF
jgi:hypothetical protein